MQVPLPGHFVERIAVGMQHVAALAGPLDRHTGRAEVQIHLTSTHLSLSLHGTSPRDFSEAGHDAERIGVCMQEGEECSVIFMWGRGREGQLGSNVHADSTIPTPVDELRGRHVLQVGLPHHLISPLCCFAISAVFLVSQPALTAVDVA